MIDRSPAELIRIGGLTKFTTIDFPGRLSCVIHMQGCPLSCRYCHSPHLQPRAPHLMTPAAPSWGEFLAWLGTRRTLLDGVVFSGGEPCLQTALPAAIADCRAAGFGVGIHSAGVYPRRLSAVLGELDWVGLDWKAPSGVQQKTTGRASMGRAFEASLVAVLRSGIDYEIRTTYHPDLLSGDDLVAMAEKLKSSGARAWVIQNFNGHGCDDADLVRSARPIDGGTVEILSGILPISIR